MLGWSGVRAGVLAGVLALASFALACDGGSSDAIPTTASPGVVSQQPAAASEPASPSPPADPPVDPSADYALADVTFNYLVAPDSTVAETLAALQNAATDPSAEPISVPGSLADFAGRPLVINFWASWCPPCVLEMPEFEKVHQALGAEVAFLGVNVQDDPEDALNLATETGVSYSLAADPSAEIQLGFAIISLPATLFISPDGQELDRWVGVLDETELENRITANFGNAADSG